MSEQEIKQVSAAQEEVKEVLEDYWADADPDDLDDAAARIVNIMLNALDEQAEDMRAIMRPT